MREHVRSQLAIALDAASAWLSPKEAGKSAAEILGDLCGEQAEHDKFALHIEEAVALLRKWRS